MELGFSFTLGFISFIMKAADIKENEIHEINFRYRL